MDAKIQVGTLLISEPFMKDPHFDRTVVLIVDHDDKGSVGFVLNRPSEIPIQQVMPIFPQLQSRCYIGGPVAQDTLHFIHSCAQIDGCKTIGGNLFWSGSFEDLRSKISKGEVSAEELQFFLGYSGWSAGQLDEEIEMGSWIISHANDKAVFLELDDLWQKVLQKMGGKYSMISRFPKDPKLN